LQVFAENAMLNHPFLRPLSLFLPAAFVTAIALSGCGHQTSAPSDESATADQKSLSVAELTANPNGAAGATPANSSASTIAVASAATPNVAPAAPVTSPEPFDESRYARVVSVQPLHGPQEVCSDQTVTAQRPQEDKHQVAGTVIGAVAGGLIGSKFGRGRGRKLATVGGAVGGGIVGKNIQENHQANDTVTRVEQRCHTITPDQNGRTLFDVVYAYQGQNLHVKLDRDPGDRIALPVRGVE
jgi:uncharacterized protein YcfJ